MTRPIFVWIDHTARYEGNSGVQRVVRSLIKALQARGRELVCVSWSPAEYTLVRAGTAELETLARYDGPPASEPQQAGVPLHLNGLDGSGLEGAWLLVPEVPPAGGRGQRITADLIDYAHSKGMKTAFIFYDLVPLLVDGYEDMRETQADYVQQMALADLVLPISEHAGETLRRYYDDTLRLPVSSRPMIVDLPLAEAFGDGRRPEIAPAPSNGPIRIMALGTIEPRKNQVALLRAFNRLCARRSDLDLELHVVGHLHPGVAADFQALAAANPRINDRRYLSDAEVIDLYRRSTFSVFASVEEGFGLPIAESLWFGRPVVCASFGAMEEIARSGGCLAIDTHSEEAIELAIEQMADDPVLRARLGVEAKRRSFRSWEAYAGSVEQALANHTPLRRVWCYVHGTIATPYNSGIQRVARAMGSGLQELGVDLVCVRWDAEIASFAPLSSIEAKDLAAWNGPGPREGEAPSPSPGEWVIVPEITMAPGPSAETLIAAARRLGLRVAYVFYDLIPLKLSAKWPGARAEPIYETPVAEAYEAFWKQAALADAVLPISRAAGRDLMAWLRRSLPRQVGLDRRVVPIELAGAFANSPRQTGGASRPRRGAPFTVLSVGTLEPRKNHLRLVRAFREARRRRGAPAMRLIIAGSHRPYPDYAAAVLAEAGGLDVVFVEQPDDAKLARLYEQADLVAYASYEEGFALPVVESAWFGRPCLCHNEGAILETSSPGGAETVDMLDETAIADALHRLATDRVRLGVLEAQARARPIRTWREYAGEVAAVLGRRGPRSQSAIRSLPGFRPPAFSAMEHPLLSICVTTYNRAPWLAHSLPRILELARPYRDVIEVLVCDNAATDNTPAVVAKIAETETFAYHRNAQNVGMLGNMGVTARHASGEYVWLVGDDDILVEGVIENVLEGILDHPDAELVYLNYAVTEFDEPDKLNAIDSIISSARVIANGGDNRYASQLRDVAALNENLFTAIYACIFRRNHALRAYTQDVSGPPFTTLARCVPSTVYAMDMMLDLPAYWVGAPGLVVNMNVSWREWLSLWSLERMPELYDWAEAEGMSAARLDQYRWNHASTAPPLIEYLYFKASEEVRSNFDIVRYLERTLHVGSFRAQVLPQIRDIYRRAAEAGRLKADDPSPEELFATFGLPSD